MKQNDKDIMKEQNRMRLTTFFGSFRASPVANKGVDSSAMMLWFAGRKVVWMRHRETKVAAKIGCSEISPYILTMASPYHVFQPYSSTFREGTEVGRVYGCQIGVKLGDLPVAVSHRRSFGRTGRPPAMFVPSFLSPLPEAHFTEHLCRNEHRLITKVTMVPLCEQIVEEPSDGDLIEAEQQPRPTG